MEKYTRFFSEAYTKPNKTTKKYSKGEVWKTKSGKWGLCLDTTSQEKKYFDTKEDAQKYKSKKKS